MKGRRLTFCFDNRAGLSGVVQSVPNGVGDCWRIVADNGTEYGIQQFAFYRVQPEQETTHD